METYVLNVTPACLAAVCKGHEKILATAKELEALQDLQRQHAELQAQLASAGRGTAKRAIADARAAYQTEPTTENLARLRDTETDPAKVEQRYATVRQVVKDQIRKVSAAAQPIRAQIYGRIVARVASEETALREVEEKAAAHFGVEFSPSATVRALEGLRRNLTHGDASAVSYSPLGDLGPIFKI